MRRGVDEHDNIEEVMVDSLLERLSDGAAADGHDCIEEAMQGSLLERRSDETAADASLHSSTATSSRGWAWSALVVRSIFWWSSMGNAAMYIC